MNYFFTSDTHFGHHNIIKYSKRPFKNVDEMDEALIANWNAKVTKNDIVFHLGDFSFAPAENYVPRLNGTIRLIRGNHDHPADRLQHAHRSTNKQPFISIDDVRQIVVKDQRIWLSHYAHRVWPSSHHGCWHLYGHSHGSLPDDRNSLSFDCGVDCHNYTPLSFEEVQQIMSKKTFKPIDHHGRA